MGWNELITDSHRSLGGRNRIPALMVATLAAIGALAKIEIGSPEVDYAYGDSSSDFTACANAGVPQAGVWALKRSSASSRQSGVWNACPVNYTGHLAFIDSLPAGG